MFFRRQRSPDTARDQRMSDLLARVEDALQRFEAAANRYRPERPPLSAEDEVIPPR